MQKLSELAGKPAPRALTLDIHQLINAYYHHQPDVRNPRHLVHFGTSGHRGSPLESTFNEQHVLAICQAICAYRQQQQITGPLFIGMDTHALSEPAFITATEVFAANEIQIFYSDHIRYTPTPVISHAILKYNRHHRDQADGVIITPSHNSPQDGGIKYNPPTGAPADIQITKWIETKANDILRSQLKSVLRVAQHTVAYQRYLYAYNYLTEYIQDLANVIAMDRVHDAQIKIGVDPLGGAGTLYWPMIAEYYHLNLTVINNTIDPAFAFLNVDWDGALRMDPTSPYIVSHLIKNKSQYDLSFALDADHDRQGIITPVGGLLDPNHYLVVMIHFLFKHRPEWQDKMIGKTFVTSSMVDWLAQSLQRPVYEVPVGFRWFTDKLLSGELGVCGEQSSGATFSCFDGRIWTTDKDGIITALLAAEIMAEMQKDLHDIYQEISTELGHTFYQRVHLPVTYTQKQLLAKELSMHLSLKQFAGEACSVQTHARGNGADLNGIKINTEKGWCALRPSGTESIYEIFAESYVSADHLKGLLSAASHMIEKIQQVDKELHG